MSARAPGGAGGAGQPPTAGLAAGDPAAGRARAHAVLGKCSVSSRCFPWENHSLSTSFADSFPASQLCRFSSSFHRFVSTGLLNTSHGDYSRVAMNAALERARPFKFYNPGKQALEPSNNSYSINSNNIYSINSNNSYSTNSNNSYSTGKQALEQVTLPFQGRGLRLDGTPVELRDPDRR